MLSERYKRYIYWTMVICWMAVLFVLSGQSAEKSSSVSGKVIEVVATVIKPSFTELDVAEKSTFIGELQATVRNLAHYFSYCVLGTLLSLAMQTHSLRLRLRKQMLWSLTIGVIYAISDEIHQYFVPGRSMQLSDIILDSFGVLTGILLVNYRALLRLFAAAG
jgi:VanZ family protein